MWQWHEKTRVGSVAMQWYVSTWDTPWTRLPFTTNLHFCGNTRVCVRTQIARGDRLQDIHHLQGEFLLFPSPGRGLRKGGRLQSLQAFYYVFPKTAVVQTWLPEGKSVISTPDRSNTRRLWLIRFKNPSCHLSDMGCLPWGWFPAKMLRGGCILKL